VKDYVYFYLDIKWIDYENNVKELLNLLIKNYKLRKKLKVKCPIQEIKGKVKLKKPENYSESVY
jgi:hypothetical protein